MHGETGSIRGAPDEWVDGIQCSNKLRLALLWEDDENYEEVHQEKYQNEFIFNLFQFLILGGSMNQYDDDVTEYLTETKNLYKDLVTVAKDQETGDVKTQCFVFKINGITSDNGPKIEFDNHPQDFFYVIVDPLHWHVTCFTNKWST